ncbi:unnamed protein product, partial [Tenebrio molitor]
WCVPFGAAKFRGPPRSPKNLPFYRDRVTPRIQREVPYREGVPESPSSKLPLSSPFQRKGVVCLVAGLFGR